MLDEEDKASIEGSNSHQEALIFILEELDKAYEQGPCSFEAAYMGIRRRALKMLTPSNQSLLEMAKRNPPPPSWYEEGELPFDEPLQDK